jgi:hypothetical protein
MEIGCDRMRFRLTILWVAVLLISTVALSAHAGEHWRLVSIPLDMPLDAQFDLDGQALEGFYQGDYGTAMLHKYAGYIGQNLKSSGLNESPFYRINSMLKEGRELELWFSSAEEGRKVFGVRLNVPYSNKREKLVSDATREVEMAFGKPDLEFSPADMATEKILVIADRTMPKERYGAVISRLPKTPQIGQKDADSFWNARSASINPESWDRSSAAPYWSR